MARLTTPYIHSTPVLLLALSGLRRSVLLAGVVDSGADRTLLPASVASRLGFADEDLVATPDGSGGAGGMWFPTWKLRYPISARVIASFPAPRGFEMWGPQLSLRPEFAKDTVALWGRGDFFASFVITFDQTAAPVFHLDSA